MTVTDFNAAKHQALETAATRGPGVSSAFSGEGLPFAEYTDAEWAKIAAEASGRAGASVRSGLTWGGRRFWSAYGARLHLLEIGERERLERGLEQVRAIKVTSVDHYGMPHAPELVEPLEDYFQTCLNICPGTSGIDDFREDLFELVLRVWTDELGGELKYYPKGPLVRFVRAALQPILGSKTPKPRAIYDIMRREQQRRLKRTVSSPKI